MNNNKKSGISRREFLGNTAKAAAVFTIVPSQRGQWTGLQSSQR